MPKVSVIVPVYNVEKYLNRCVNSILSQTFTDFELLLIDDGSLDSSGFICDEYANQDSRVKVFHKENGGVSSARNLGIQNAFGEWISFIDSDDWVNSTFIAQFAESFFNEDTEIIIAGATVVSEFNNKILFFYDNGIYDIDVFWDSQYHHLACWGYCFSSKILISNNILFNTDLIMSEDQIFIFEYLTHINKITTISNVNYNYYQNPQSVCNSEMTVEKINSQWNALIFLINNYSTLKDTFYFEIKYSIIEGLLRNFIDSTIIYDNRFQVWGNFIKIIRLLRFLKFQYCKQVFSVRAIKSIIKMCFVCGLKIK